jgi:hypothetical protein
MGKAAPWKSGGFSAALCYKFEAGFSPRAVLVDVAKMLRGDFRQFSVERLLRFLIALDQDVHIVLKPHHNRKNAPPSQCFELQFPAEDTNMTSPAINDSPTLMRDLRWSPAEKAIARKVYEAALKQELEDVVRETKEMAAKIEQVGDVWDLEYYLTKRRLEIDRQYDYRYSVLPEVFGNLIRKGRVREEDLRGLSDDKLEYIQIYSKI